MPFSTFNGRHKCLFSIELIKNLAFLGERCSQRELLGLKYNLAGPSSAYQSVQSTSMALNRVTMQAGELYCISDFSLSGRRAYL